MEISSENLKFLRFSEREKVVSGLEIGASDSTEMTGFAAVVPCDDKMDVTITKTNASFKNINAQLAENSSGFNKIFTKSSIPYAARVSNLSK